MAILFKFDRSNSAVEFDFIAEFDNDLRYGDTFELEDTRYSVSSNPTNHMNTVDGIHVIETHFSALKLL